ncbi:hypothetical protein JTB14_036404 [Gonioctena quinquepunctata]|nr:hypothetical protein JTB14_036404 [Gonioctena quinquepunctata]
MSLTIPVVTSVRTMKDLLSPLAKVGVVDGQVAIHSSVSCLGDPHGWDQAMRSAQYYCFSVSYSDLFHNSVSVCSIGIDGDIGGGIAAIHIKFFQM